MSLREARVTNFAPQMYKRAYKHGGGYGYGRPYYGGKFKKGKWKH